MKRFLKAISLVTLALLLCTLCAMAALEDINEDTCTVIKETVKKGTPTIDGKLDAIYKDSMTLKLHGPATSYYISGGSCEDTTATGTVYALHDDNYVYVFFHVVDNTLIQADPEYVEISAHPHLTDSVEVRIGDDLEDHFAPYDGSNDAHHLLYADAHGVRYSCYEDSMGDDVEKLKHKTKLDPDGKTYYVEMAIPLQKPFSNGEIIEFEFQINDLQDTMDSMCAVGSGYPHNLVQFRAESTYAGNHDYLSGDINEDTCTVVKDIVKKYTPTIDGVFDSSYAESLTLKLHGPASSYFINDGSCEDTTATGTVWATYDDNYVYVFYEVVDNTLTKASNTYVITDAHPHLSDAVEVRVGDGGTGHFPEYPDAMANCQHLIYADAHGRRLTAYEDMIYESELKGEAVIDGDGKTYRVEMAIPTEKPFEKGDTIYLEFQIDDLQDRNDSMCAIGSGYPHNLVAFTIGGAVSTKITAEPKTTSAGRTVDVPVAIVGNAGLAGLGLSVTYDEALTLKAVSRGDALASLDMTTSKDISVQPTTILFDGIDADSTNGEFLVLTFEVDENAAEGNYSIIINVTDAYDDDVANVDIEGVRIVIAVEDYIPGDISGDGEVDLKDVTVLRRYLAGGYGVTVQEAALDINRDGAIDLKDVTVLRRYLAGGYGITLE